MIITFNSCCELIKSIVIDDDDIQYCNNLSSLCKIANIIYNSSLTLLHNLTILNDINIQHIFNQQYIDITIIKNNLPTLHINSNIYFIHYNDTLSIIDYDNKISLPIITNINKIKQICCISHQRLYDDDILSVIILCENNVIYTWSNYYSNNYLLDVKKLLEEHNIISIYSNMCYFLVITSNNSLILIKYDFLEIDIYNNNINEIITDISYTFHTFIIVILSKKVITLGYKNDVKNKLLTKLCKKRKISKIFYLDRDVVIIFTNNTILLISFSYPQEYYYKFNNNINLINITKIIKIYKYVIIALNNKNELVIISNNLLNINITVHKILSFETSIIILSNDNILYEINLNNINNNKCFSAHSVKPIYREKNIKDIYKTNNNLILLTNDNILMINIDNEIVILKQYDEIEYISYIQKIITTDTSIAILTKENIAIIFYSQIENHINNYITKPIEKKIISDVVDIYTNNFSFVIIKRDGCMILLCLNFFMFSI